MLCSRPSSAAALFKSAPPAGSKVGVETLLAEGAPLHRHANRFTPPDKLVQQQLNQPKLPMPNRINVLFETFEQGGFTSTNGLLVGIDKSLPVDSSKKYGWLLAPKNPWYGYPLGDWDDDLEEEARLAVAGDYLKNGEKLKTQRKKV